MRKPPTTERGRRAAERWERWRQAQQVEVARIKRLQLEAEGQLELNLSAGVMRGEKPASPAQVAVFD